MKPGIFLSSVMVAGSLILEHDSSIELNGFFLFQNLTALANCIGQKTDLYTVFYSSVFDLAVLLYVCISLFSTAFHGFQHESVSVSNYNGHDSAIIK